MATAIQAWTTKGGWFMFTDSRSKVTRLYRISNIHSFVKTPTSNGMVTLIIRIGDEDINIVDAESDWSDGVIAMIVDTDA